jgi:hypothetical protein
MRLAGKQKLGYFPLPLPEAERIRRFLQFPLSDASLWILASGRVVLSR